VDWRKRRSLGIEINFRDEKEDRRNEYIRGKN
jgi:hypothetical protein